MRVLTYESYSVAGCEEVTMPAGTFSPVRIEVSQIYTRAPAAAGRDYTLWYAPAVKYWVKRAGGRASFWDPVVGSELQILHD